MRLLLGTILTGLIGWWFLAVHASGRVELHMGSRIARGTFEAYRATDPGRFHATLVVIAVLFLIAVAATASAAWDIVAASRRGSDQDI